MAMRSRFTGSVALALMVLLGSGMAFLGPRGGGGNDGPAAAARNPSAGMLTPAMMEEAARKAAKEIVIWGTSTVFQLKQATQLKFHVERVRRERSMGTGAPSKMDPSMYKQVVEGAVGSVFLAVNSPAMGKVSEIATALMKDNKRQARVIELDKRVREAMSNRSKSKMAAAQDPDGFLEGALLNKDVSAAHDRFVADVEALANSGLAKRVASSAEAYHDVMLQYATDERSTEPSETD